MPRLPPSLTRRARAVDPLLALLLRPCRELNSARNELRWLGEQASELLANARRDSQRSNRNLPKWRLLLRALVDERARGRPLQYILGTEYFGELELFVKKGVLIPRPDTAQAISHLASLLQRASHPKGKEVRVLDLCTGTGCIPLLLQHESATRSFATHRNRNTAESRAHAAAPVRCLGVDVSPDAVALAERNRKKLLKEVESHVTGEREGYNTSMRAALHRTAFVQGDILDTRRFLAQLAERGTAKFDVLLCNPPYISPQSFSDGTTQSSVRKYEPKLALVPPQLPKETIDYLRERIDLREERSLDLADIHPGDSFYPVLLHIGREIDAKVLWFEVADMAQAVRVGKMIRALAPEEDVVEIWREDLSSKHFPTPEQTLRVEHPGRSHDAGTGAHATSLEHHDYFGMCGQGNARSVIWWRGREGRRHHQSAVLDREH